MSEVVLAIFSVTLPIFAFIATGVLAERLQLLGRDATNVLNRFVVYLALPALLFDVMAQTRWIDPAYIEFLIAFGGGTAVTFLAGAALARRDGKRLADCSIQGLGASFSNAGFIGIPLCRLALGEESVVPAVIATVLNSSLLFGCAIAMIESDLQKGPNIWRTSLKVGPALARSPLLLAPAAGALFAATGLRIPAGLSNFTSLLGGAATPCALIALGIFLAESSIRLEPVVIGRLVTLKLVLQPTITGFLAFSIVHLPSVWAKTALLASALPTGTVPFILSKLYEREAQSTTSTIVVSTALSFVTVSGLLVWFALVRLAV